jgi:hypothetical protein
MNQQNPKKEGGAGASVKAEMAALGAAVLDRTRGAVGMESTKRVLDPCCGGRMMWFDRENPDVVFGDQRSETLVVTDNSRGNKSGQRTLRIEPDMVMDFRDLP